MNIYKIVFTGGPCAGKTTVIDSVKKKLIEDGYYVIVVPETAAELIRNGIIPNDDRRHTLRFQELVLETQIRKEKLAEEYCDCIKDSKIGIVDNSKGIVILYDRGIMDNRAYLSHEDYNNMLRKYNYNELAIIDQYDLVINLISLATTRPEAYCLDGIRYESPEEAAHRDTLTSGAWLLHRNLKVVKPTDDINDKVNIVLNYIYDLLENRQKEEEKQFEVDKEGSDLSSYNDDNSRRIKIRKIYLQSFDNLRLTLYKRQYNGNVSFVMKKKKLTSDNIEFVESRPITQNDYNELLATSLVKEIIEQDILHFIDRGNHFSLVESNSSVELHVDSDNISEIPKNIVLKKSKTLIK